jgi:putative hydrolase of the HAD superfamily
MVGPEDIDAAGRTIRANAGPVAGTAMTHTDVRMRAIRSEMEKCATMCGRLGEKVKDADVERVYSAWERERHHSAERHLYPDVISTLLQIKEAHPDVIIGAVTDGKANPLQMVFTLAPFFDFCTSWEDDAAGRAGFFKELSDANGHADLQWIYRTAYEKYIKVAESRGLAVPPPPASNDDDDCDRPVWIHIGDDLAYDVGGSASCGAHTILLDLDEEYRQTSKNRFLWGNNAVMPSWSTASDDEIAKRRAMNDASEMMVDKRVTRLSVLADAIDEILKGE